MFRIVLTLILLLSGSAAIAAEKKIAATLYKQPYCSCCDGHADHLTANGFKVTVIESKNMTSLKKKFGIPQQFEGCHTITIGDYVVEGHVPATIIHKMLKERPAIRGISLPGMPDGSPGMSGEKKEPFVVYELSAENAKVFAKE